MTVCMHLRLTILAFLLLLTTSHSLRAQMPKYGKNDGKKELTEGERKELLAEIKKGADETERLRKAGKLEEAVAAAEKIISPLIEVHGESHGSPIEWLDWIGKQYEQLEKFPEAKKCRARGIELKIKRFGKNDYKVTNAKVQLEYLNVVEKLTPTERQELRAAETDRRKFLSEFDYEASMPAIDLCESILKTKRRLLGVTHPSYAHSLNDLALSYVNNGEYEKAESIFFEALSVYKTILGETHPDYANNLNNLAMLYDSKGDSDKGEFLYIRSLAIKKKYARGDS